MRLGRTNGEPAVLHFLVVHHGIEDLLPIELGDFDRQAEGFEKRAKPGGKRRINAAEAFGQSRSANHADRNRLAVQQGTRDSGIGDWGLET